MAKDPYVYPGTGVLRNNLEKSTIWSASITSAALTRTSRASTGRTSSCGNCWSRSSIYPDLDWCRDLSGPRECSTTAMRKRAFRIGLSVLLGVLLSGLTVISTQRRG
jgi:hypothetical protein